MINDWTIMGKGSGANDIRIHTLTRMIGKTRLYRLYRINGGEHRVHEQHAREINPKNCRFEAAA